MTTLHHIALGAQNIERLADFYQEFFELSALKIHPDDHGEIRSIWLDLSPGILMLEKSAHTDAPLKDMALGKGPFLLAFTMEEKDKDNFLQKLTEQNLSLEGQTDFTYYFRDPENNRVAVSTYHPASV